MGKSERFHWRGFEGYCFRWTAPYGNPPAGARVNDWVARLWIAGAKFGGSGKTRRAAIAKCRRQLDKVRKAMLAAEVWP